MISKSMKKRINIMRGLPMDHNDEVFELKLKDIFESLSLCINDVPFHGNNKLISARQDKDHLLIFIPGYYIDLNPDGTYSIYGDCDGE